MHPSPTTSRAQAHRLTMSAAPHPESRFPTFSIQDLEAVPGVRSVAIQLTPAVAKRLLDRNVHNRKISEKIVQKYAEEIKAGEWRLTPQGIGINDRGELVDGQHRLSAIIRANQTVPMLITVGLPAASQEKVDRQRRRTLFDALYLAGKATCRQEVEIATCITRMRMRSDSAVVPTDAAVKAMLDVHQESISVILARGAAKRVRGLSQASFLAAAVLYHELAPGKCLEFLDGVRTGVMLTQDHPAMRLRRFLMGETAVASMPRGGANQTYIFRRSVYAMQAHWEGRMISGLREAEDFVIPRSTSQNSDRSEGPESDE